MEGAPNRQSYMAFSIVLTVKLRKCCNPPPLKTPGSAPEVIIENSKCLALRLATREKVGERAPHRYKLPQLLLLMII